MADLAQPRQIFFGVLGRDSEVERLVLDIALAEREGDFGLGEFRAEIEGMRRVVRHCEKGIERHGIARYVMAVAIIEMDAVFGDFDAIICIAHVSRTLFDLRRRREEGLEIMDLKRGRRHSPSAKPASLRAAYISRRAASCSLSVRRVCGLTCTTSTLRIESSEQRPSNRAVTPLGIGLGQLGEIARAHHHLRVGHEPPRLDVAFQRSCEAELDRIEHGIENEGNILGRAPSPPGARSESRSECGCGIRIGVTG